MRRLVRTYLCQIQNKERYVIISQQYISLILIYFIQHLNHSDQHKTIQF